MAKECRLATRFFGAFWIVRWKTVELYSERNRYLIMTNLFLSNVFEIVMGRFVLDEPLSSYDSHNCSWCCFEEVVSYYCWEEYAGSFFLDISFPEKFVLNCELVVRFLRKSRREILSFARSWNRISLGNLFVEYVVIDIWCKEFFEIWKLEFEKF